MLSGKKENTIEIDVIDLIKKYNLSADISRVVKVEINITEGRPSEGRVSACTQVILHYNEKP